MEEKLQKVHARLHLLTANNSNTTFGVDDGSYSISNISGYSSLNSAYEYKVRFVSDEELNISEIIDTDVKIVLKDENSRLRTRSIFGKVYKIEQASSVATKKLYSITVVSPFYYLNFNKRYKIYQEMTAIDIITQIIGMSKHILNLQVVNKLDGITFAKREICTQYNQSDAEFILMLAQEEKFSIIFDANSNNMYDMVLVNINDHAKKLDEVLISSYNLSKSFTSTSQVANFYDFENPSLDYDTKNGTNIDNALLEDNKTTSQLRTGIEVERIRDRLELMDGSRKKDLNRYTKLNSSQDYASAENIVGNSVSLYTEDSLAVVLKEKRTYRTLNAILTTTNLEANFPDALDEYVDENEEYYFNINFTAIPEETLFTTSDKEIVKPRIFGVQTAIVAQGAENTVDVDSLGRIRVIFHFDRAKPTTCYIRLGTMFSGNNWGAQFLPRVNTEVIVSFINGNIDKPIIIGAVYNGNNKIPYDLPAHKTRSYIKTNSMPAVSPQGYNELLFEDKGGQELLSLRAQKDYKLHALHDSQINIDNDQVEEVGRDESVTIGHDRTEEVKNDEKITIGHDRTEEVKNDEKITIGNNETISIGNDSKETVGNNENISIGNNRTESVGNNESITIGNNKSISIGSSLSTNIGTSQSTNVGSKKSLDVGQSYKESIGQNKTETISIAKALTIGAGYQITVGGAKNETVGLTSTEQVGILKHIIAGKRFELQVGASSLILNSDGTIMLKGIKIGIDGAKQVKVNGQMIDLN